MYKGSGIVWRSGIVPFSFHRIKMSKAHISFHIYQFAESRFSYLLQQSSFPSQLRRFFCFAAPHICVQKSQLALNGLRQAISAHAMLAKLQKSSYCLLMETLMPTAELHKTRCFLQIDIHYNK